MPARRVHTPPRRLVVNRWLRRVGGTAKDVSSAPGPIVGNLPCTRAGCSADNAVSCAYVDRRGSRCQVASCPDDQLLVDGRPYCARHGRVVRVLRVDELGSHPLPDLDNRTASLVDYVAQAVDPQLKLTLHAVWPEELSLGIRPLGVHYAAPDRRRVWTRRWALRSQTGNAVTVTLTVAEDQDHVLIVSVDSRPIAEMVPPWIPDRSVYSTVALRQAFYDSIVGAASHAVQQAHEHDADVVFRDRAPELLTMV